MSACWAWLKVPHMLSRLFPSKPAKSSPFSEFIRTASAAEKKRVYADVLKKATERQNQVEAKARAKKGPEEISA
ncbi:hypothetical protein [Pseudoxanthomonas koreensis]|uniref:hypothetical protein n=1 Tax=Pseudoxanthomonas koreensis TaxID=266061 RepID=UPI001EE4AA06|nr:hypothetical protein [Pseudoxanthomonas koreensis]